VHESHPGARISRDGASARSLPGCGERAVVLTGCQSWIVASMVSRRAERMFSDLECAPIGTGPDCETVARAVGSPTGLGLVAVVSSVRGR
jgi:hypothetical protein